MCIKKTVIQEEEEKNAGRIRYSLLAPSDQSVVPIAFISVVSI